MASPIRDGDRRDAARDVLSSTAGPVQATMGGAGVRHRRISLHLGPVSQLRLTVIDALRLFILINVICVASFVITDNLETPLQSLFGVPH